jgi:hypothetical protein
MTTSSLHLPASLTGRARMRAAPSSTKALDEAALVRREDMEATDARVVRGKNPIRYPIWRYARGLMHKTDLAHKITDRPKKSTILS